jgi:histone-lysine N-methyltransferase SETMAR
MEWKHTPSPAKKKFKAHPTAGKLMITVFGESKGLLLEHYEGRVSTMNSARYSEMQCDKLKPAIRSKRRGLLPEGVVFYDIAHSHTAHTVETRKRLNFEVLKHPPYSPDLGPSDCHLFGPLQQALRGRRFTTYQQLKAAVHLWVVSQPKTLYSEGTKKTGQRWTKCIQMQGDCVEN